MSEKVFRRDPGISDLRVASAWIATPAAGTAIVFTGWAAFALKAGMDVPGALLIILMGAVVGGILGPLPSLAVGYPVHRWLRNTGWTHPAVYAAFGAIIAPATSLLIMSVLMPVFWQGYALIGIVAPFAIAGLFSGGIFWLIRRPDRDILVEETGDEAKP